MTSNTTHQKQIAQENTDTTINLSIAERWISMLSGGALAALAFRQRGALGVVLGLLSWYFTNRGLTGHCVVYEKFDINTAVKTNPDAVSVPHQQGVHVEKSIQINRSPEELYSYWRNFENLPSIMRHLESVEVLDGNRSHWVAKGPAKSKLEWDAEIVNDIPFQVIAWRSVDNADIANAGSVRFKDMDGATNVEITMEYVPPAGKLGQAVAKLLGAEPEIQIEDDLRRFKQLAETGKTLTGWQGVDDQGGSDANGNKKNKKSSDAPPEKPDYNQPADQAEGERGGEKSTKVSKTPGQAEG